MGKEFELVCHADHPNKTPFTLSVLVEQGAMDGVILHYRLRGAVSRLMMAEPDMVHRGDELWQTSCFEIFIRSGGDGAYREYNFASSFAWAAYDFTGYRDGMKNADVVAPEIVSVIGPDFYDLTVRLYQPVINADIGLSAILEEQNGTKSYWALAHPQGKPDFHHPACFACKVTAPEAS